MSSSTPTLFTPIKVGRSLLQHRVALAPLTRFRADDNHVPTDIQREYYTQRGSAPGTLLITEATFIAPQAGGYKNVPGVWSDEQAAGWKKVVDAVHAEGSFIYLQLWALGRAADPSVLKSEGPYDMVSASDIGLEDSATPRPLTTEEINEYVGLYAQAAKNFVEKAGGDGVEIHGANGYLLDQFLQTTSNRRTDAYGGSIENRIKFPLEVLKAVTDAVGEDRTGIRISPFSAFQGMKMEPEELHNTFSTYVKAIKNNFPDLAYIHAVQPRVAGNADIDGEVTESLDFIYDIWTPKVFLTAGGFTPEQAKEITEKDKNVVVAFGRKFIANPDLKDRLEKDLSLNPYNRDTFYAFGGTDNPEGYTNYPFYEETKA